MELLLANGADPGKEMATGETPCHSAAEGEHVGVVGLLPRAAPTQTARVDSPQNTRMGPRRATPPLGMATSALEALLAGGANPDRAREQDGPHRATPPLGVVTSAL